LAAALALLLPASIVWGQTSRAQCVEAFYGRHNYGQAAYLLARNEFAIEQFSLALRLKPDSARTLQGRGWAYLKSCHFDEAQRDFAQALRLDATRRPELATTSDIASQRARCAAAANPPAPRPGQDACDPNPQASCRAQLAHLPGIVYREQWLEKLRELQNGSAHDLRKSRLRSLAFRPRLSRSRMADKRSDVADAGRPVRTSFGES